VIRDRGHAHAPADVDPELEHDAIPDIAMPDPHDLFR
jgi:twitching motility two-component system response regulator PilH